MGAQVVFAVNHAYLDKLDEGCLNWLGLQASINAGSPRTWLASDWDKHDRSITRSRGVPDVRPILSFSYCDYALPGTMLVAHDMILELYGLQSLNFKDISEFSGLAKQMASKARYHQHPFHDRSCKHNFSKPLPKPVEAGGGSITLFLYDTDSWSWGNNKESRDKLAAVAQFCATGKHGAFPYDAQSGEFMNSFRPLCTIGPEQRAIVRLRDARQQVIILPQRPMKFPDLLLEVGCSDLDILKAVMASEGYDYVRDSLRKAQDYSL